MDPADKPVRRPRQKPESETTRKRRLQALAVRLADREHRAATALAILTGALPRARGHVTPLEKIADETRRLEVWRARVERLEALLDRTERKRETRAKIVLGATLLAEAQGDPDDPLMARIMEILDRRIDRPRDRLAIAEMLDLPLASIKAAAPAELPDFDALARAAIAGDEGFVGAARRSGRGRKKGGQAPLP
ncbi:hypothetical protein PMI01_00030 [Caulobacter sp. AP07]|uniref:hypothetical protein n=1 Tax=Caulobacter sp. AP07 TaxID=1144304 RepID=UPI000271E332|nr:hypothetical protein [Caulobacter sp. AP07]EJL38463.1 hypothetical protein PMI01_00030 [Caulobacter sp. AP07]